MTKIHETAIVSPNAKIAQNVEIGPYCTISDNVEIGQGTTLKSHIVIEGSTKIGQNNVIYPFSTIGVAPQDLKFAGEDSRVEIGDNNTIREHVTIHLGTKDGAMVTKIGNNCLLMVGAHIAHDCVVGNNVILANNATLAGHVEVSDHVVIGGLSAIHQFVRIGQGAMIGGMSGVESDVIPYATVTGERAFLAGLNLIGIKRRGVERSEIHALRNFYKEIFEKEEGNLRDRIKTIDIASQPSSIKDILEFITAKTSRQFCKTKK